MPQIEAKVPGLFRRAHYPFSAIVDHRAAKHALMLLAVEPALRGVLLGVASGSAESALARSFGSLLPESDTRVNDEAAEVRDFGSVIELPLNITEDRLLGALDLERTLAAGARVISPGVLAQANGRVLCVNDINLLDSNTAAHIAHAMDSRRVRIERETISASQSADFLLIGLFNPAEGEPSPLLQERVGLIVHSIGDWSVEESAEVIDREFEFETDPLGFAETFVLEEAEIKSTIKAARARLPRIRVSKHHLRQIALVAMRLGVEGNRADSFALKAARASAALAGRNEVNEDDLVTAIRFVLAPRAMKLPLPEEETADASQNVDSSESQEPESESAEGSAATADEVIPAIDTRVPNELFRIPERVAAQNARSGKRVKGSASTRGRYVRSQARMTREARVAIDATLRAAAPFQVWRRRESILHEPVSDFSRSTPNIVANHQVKIEPSDLRYKQFKQRSGVLFIFAVDASGSMAFNRMAQAKGALSRVLQQAYLHRDKVALISFRGKSAEILLAPTGSVELARQLVDALPSGGGTPVSAGVVKAIELARFARLKGMARAMLVLFTDGRANVAWREGQTIDDELKTLGVALATQGIDSVVVDTKARFVSKGEGYALARNLGSRYLYLPRADTETIYREISSVATWRMER